MELIMEWIDVNESLPGVGKNVIACTKSGLCTMAFLTAENKWCDGRHYFNGNIRYWMPLPKAPSSESELIEIAINGLDLLRREKPNAELVIDLPESKGRTVRISDVMFYEDNNGRLVIDAE